MKGKEKSPKGANFKRGAKVAGVVVGIIGSAATLAGCTVGAQSEAPKPTVTATATEYVPIDQNEEIGLPQAETAEVQSPSEIVSQMMTETNQAGLDAADLIIDNMKTRPEDFYAARNDGYQTYDWLDDPSLQHTIFNGITGQDDSPESRDGAFLSGNDYNGWAVSIQSPEVSVSFAIANNSEIVEKNKRGENLNSQDFQGAVNLAQSLDPLGNVVNIFSDGFISTDGALGDMTIKYGDSDDGNRYSPATVDEARAQQSELEAYLDNLTNKLKQ